MTSCFSNVSTLNINSLTNHKSLYYQIHFIHPWMYNRNEKYKKKRESVFFPNRKSADSSRFCDFLAFSRSSFLTFSVSPDLWTLSGSKLGCRRKRRCPVWGGASFLWQTTILSSYRSIPRPFLKMWVFSLFIFQMLLLPIWHINTVYVDLCVATFDQD